MSWHSSLRYEHLRGNAAAAVDRCDWHRASCRPEAVDDCWDEARSDGAEAARASVAGPVVDGVGVVVVVAAGRG